MLPCPATEAGHLCETPQVDGAGAEEPALGRLASGMGRGFLHLVGFICFCVCCEDDKGGSSWSFKIRFSSEMCCEENQAKSEDTDRKTWVVPTF